MKTNTFIVVDEHGFIVQDDMDGVKQFASEQEAIQWIIDEIKYCVDIEEGDKLIVSRTEPVRVFLVQPEHKSHE